MLIVVCVRAHACTHAPNVLEWSVYCIGFGSLHSSLSHVSCCQTGGDLLNAIDVPVISTLLDATADALDCTDKEEGSDGCFESCTLKVVPRDGVIRIGDFLEILQPHVEVKLKSPFTKAQSLEYLFISGNFSFPSLPQYCFTFWHSNLFV